MNRDTYLVRVLDMIIRDSQIEGKNIIYPFSLPLYSLQNNQSYSPLHDNFIKYCKDQYGLSEEESMYMWYDYSTIMGRTVRDEDTETPEEDYINYTPLDEVYLYGNLEPQERDVKESLRVYGFNSEGHYKFFMRVYNRIIDSIEIKHLGNDNHYVLFINEFRRTRDGLFGLRLLTGDGDPDKDFITFSISYTEYIFRCCIQLMTEGLPDGGQYVSITLTDMVLKYIYENVFQNKILQRKFNINESESKEDRFLDKVYQFLINDTYEIKRNKIKLPFLNVNVSIKHDTISKYSILDVITYPSVPHMFVKYCDITYGLDLKQITILWNRYKEYLMGNFYNLKKIY